jgi:hypothetical protein
VLCPDQVAERDVVWFVDNEAAVSSLIRGTSRSGDVGHIAAIAQLRLLQLGASPWFEWIDSHSNPSDGLSRDGLEDEWTLKQGWSLGEGIQPPWGFLLGECAALDM